MPDVLRSSGATGAAHFVTITGSLFSANVNSGLEVDNSIEIPLHFWLVDCTFNSNSWGVYVSTLNGVNLASCFMAFR